MNKFNKFFSLLLLSIALVVCNVSLSFAEWGYKKEIISNTDVGVVSNENTFAVAYSGSKYYTTLNAALEDHSETGSNTSTATIVVMTTDDIISTFSLDKTKDTFLAINNAKTLTKSLVMRANKTILIPHIKGSTSYTKTKSALTDFADSTQDSMNTNLKNCISIGSGVSLTIPYKSTLSILSTIYMYNTGLTSAVGKEYAQISMHANSTLNIYGQLNCYGYIKEVKDAVGTTKINLLGSNGKDAVATIPMNLYQTIGGTATTKATSAYVFPYNLYGITNVRSTVECNYYSTIEIHFLFYATGSFDIDKKTNLMSRSNAIFVLNDESSRIITKHTQGNFITKTEYGSGSQYTNILDCVSTTKRHNNSRKTTIDMYGSCSIGKLVLNAYISIDSSDYVLPLSFEYDITVKEGATFTNNQRVCFLPGSKLTVEAGATLNLNNHTMFLTKRVMSNNAMLMGINVDPSSNQPYTGYPNAGEDDLEEINCEIGNAKLISAGTVNINAGFGGKIYSSSVGSTSERYAQLNIGDNYINLGNSTSPNGINTNRFYSVIYTKGTNFQTHDAFQSYAYFSLFDGSNLSTVEIQKGKYVLYRSADKTGWVAKEAVISYDTNGSSSSYEDKDIEISSEGYTITNGDLPNVDPVKDYYIFGGWYLDEDCTIRITDETNFVIYTSVTIYAKWIPITYTINYVANSLYDGEPFTENFENPNPTRFNAESYIMLAPASSEGYIFDGWYLDSSFANKVSAVNESSLQHLSPSNTLNLYGRWYPSTFQTYRLTYHNDNSDIECIEYEDVIETNISSIVLPDLGEKNNNLDYNKYFSGWYLDSEYTTPYTEPSQITGDTDFYALWNLKNKIIINVSGSDFEEKYLQANKEFTVPDASKFGLPADPGYEWGWLIQGGLYDGQIISSGQRVCLSDAWNETIRVILTSVPLKFNLTVNVGSNETANIVVSRNNTDIITKTALKGSNNVINGVQTDDVITVTVSASNNYDAGEITPTSGLASLGSNKYRVTGLENPVLTIENATSSCFTRGTLITLSDGSKKPIEELNINDVIRVFSHDTGEFIDRPVLAIFNHGYEEANIIKLEFDNGNVLEVANSHYLFNTDRLEYVDINEHTYADYVGEHFLADDGQGNVITTRLMHSGLDRRVEELWSIFGYHDHNAVTNGIVSLSPFQGFDLPFDSYFDFDNEFKYDAESMRNDIEQYGLYTFEEWSFCMNEWIFDAFNGPYCKVLVGKGILSEEDVLRLLSIFASFAESGQAQINFGPQP